MAEARPPIPRAMAREVRIEAGDRCAIPACRATAGLLIHHIVSWAKVREHTFDNLIYLCANCHARIHAGDIDTLSVKQYKANLSVIAQRYGDLERRVLESFASSPELDLIELPGGYDLLMRYLLLDGYVVQVPAPNNYMTISGNVGLQGYELTPAGREFIQHWLAADPLD